jgi:hypothetical protein
VACIFAVVDTVVCGDDLAEGRPSPLMMYQMHAAEFFQIFVDTPLEVAELPALLDRSG